MSSRYFEIKVSEGGFTSSRRFDDILLRSVQIPLGELLEKTIEGLRQECVKAMAEKNKMSVLDPEKMKGAEDGFSGSDYD